jgi:hypothetical protein
MVISLPRPDGARDIVACDDFWLELAWIKDKISLT